MDLSYLQDSTLMSWESKGCLPWFNTLLVSNRQDSHRNRRRRRDWGGVGERRAVENVR